MTNAVTTSVAREPFDPLVDFDGLWTPELAERYLPIEGAHLLVLAG